MLFPACQRGIPLWRWEFSLFHDSRSRATERSKIKTKQKSSPESNNFAGGQAHSYCSFGFSSQCCFNNSALKSRTFTLSHAFPGEKTVDHFHISFTSSNPYSTHIYYTRHVQSGPVLPAATAGPERPGLCSTWCTVLCKLHETARIAPVPPRAALPATTTGVLPAAALSTTVATAATTAAPVPTTVHCSSYTTAAAVYEHAEHDGTTLFNICTS